MNVNILSIQGPLMVVGDFTLIQYPQEKNNGQFDQRPTADFNAPICNLALIELPLSDQRFTWTNRRDRQPWLAWIMLSSTTVGGCSPKLRSQITSSHDLRSHPLLLSASTSIPCSSHFLFENAWLLHPLFLPTTSPAWAFPVPRRNATATIVVGKKILQVCQGLETCSSVYPAS